jgi:hypothetical protein
VSRSRITSLGGSDPKAPGRHTVLIALLAALAAATSFTVVVAPPHAAANQIADLKAEAAAVSQKLVQDQLQVGADQQLYAVSTQKVSTDTRAITQIGQELGQAEAEITK